MGSGPDEEQSFRLQFLEARGVAFQNLFSNIMDRAFPGDFQRVRPHGKTGDLKCDGYLRSRRTVFQVYGPDEIRRLQPLLRKIEEDFNGACTHWVDRMDEWVFVHNSLDGLPAQAIQLLGDLAGRTGAPRIEAWGYERLRAIASQGGPQAQRPSLDAMRVYWQWLSEANRPEQTPHHLALLDRLLLPIRLADANIVRDWGQSPPADVAKQVRAGQVWQIADANDQAPSHGEAHARFYSMLRKHRHLLITGDSGSGKSTLLRRFASNQARKLLQAGAGKGGRHTPVLVELWRFSPNRPVLDLIYDSVSRSNAGIARDEFLVALELGYILLLLDGVDEVSREHRRECLAQVHELIERFPRAPLVLTSRYFPVPPAGFHEVAIAPLLVHDIKAAFAAVDSGWTNHRTMGDWRFTDGGWSIIPPDILALCSRPLTLGFVLYALSQGDSVPNTLYALYDRSFSGLFEWEVRCGRLNSVASTSLFLEDGAYRMTLQRTRGLSVSEWITHAAPRSDGQTNDCLSANENAENALRIGTSVGLLKSEGGEVSFAHRSFQEFYTAKGLVRTGVFRSDHVARDLGVLRFLIGPIHDPTKLLTAALDDVEDTDELASLLRTASNSGCEIAHFEALHWAIETSRELGVEISHGLRAVPEDLEQMSTIISELVGVALHFRPKAVSILLNAAYGIAAGARFDESAQWLEQVIDGLEQYKRDEAPLLRRFLAIWTFDSPAGADDFEHEARFEEWSEHYSEFLDALAKQDVSDAESRLSEMIELMTAEPDIDQAYRCPETLDLFDGCWIPLPKAD